MGAQLSPLSAIVSPDVTASIGLPRAAPGGRPWHYSRAGYPYSLASELSSNADRATLGSLCTQLEERLNPAKKNLPLGERPLIPPRWHFECGLNSDQRNPADVFALRAVAHLVARSKGPVSLPNAVQKYVLNRTRILEHVQKYHYQQLKIPAYDSPARIQLVRDAIRSNLPVMAFPYHFPNATTHGAQGTWCYALLPDLPAVETSEVVRVLGIWYRVLAEERKVQGNFTAQQLADLRAIVPEGMSPLLQYLVCTLTNRATWRALGISDGVARSVRLRFDALTLRELPAARREAEEHVMQKLIKTSGRQAKDLRRAINNRLRKISDDRKWLRAPHQVLVRTAVGAVLRAPDVLAVLRDIAHNFSASFKGASGNTPEDMIYIEEVSKEWGKEGSQTQRILHLFNVYLLHHLNRKVSPKMLRNLFKQADVKCVKAVNTRDPSDAQYWARRGLKSVKQLFSALATWAVYLGGDAAQLKKIGVAGKERGEYQCMDARRFKPDHEAGLDNIASIGQFAVAVLPITQYAAVFDGEADGFMACDLKGWSEGTHFSPRDGLAVMVGYNERLEKETQLRNTKSMLKVMTEWPAHFACPDGDVAPLMALECDNGKLGKFFHFLMGLLFLSLDVTMLVTISNAAHWSAMGFIETVIGGAATRQRGKVLDLGDLPAPDTARPDELLPHIEAAIDTLMAATNGFPWRGVKGHAHKASELPSPHELFDCAEELAEFFAASATERAAFVFKTPMPHWKAATGDVGLEVTCRLAIKHFESANSATSMFRMEQNRWTWSKYGGALPGQVNVDALQDRLPPEVQLTLQGSLIDGFFPVRVPSTRHEFKLAGWAESLERREELSKIGKENPDKFYPPAVLRRLHVELNLGPMLKANQPFDDALKLRLRRATCLEWETIEFVTKARVAGEERLAKNAVLDQLQERNGMYSAVRAYIWRVRPKLAPNPSAEKRKEKVGSCTVADMRDVLLKDLGVKRAALPRWKAQAVAKIFELAKLSTQQATLPGVTAAAAAATAAVNSAQAAISAAQLAAATTAAAAAVDAEQEAEEQLQARLEKERRQALESELEGGDELDAESRNEPIEVNVGPEEEGEEEADDEAEGEEETELGEGQEVEAETAAVHILEELMDCAEGDPDAAVRAIVGVPSIWRCCNSGAKTSAWKCGACNLWTHRSCQHRPSGGDRANPLCKPCFEKSTATLSTDASCEDGGQRKSRRMR